MRRVDRVLDVRQGELCWVAGTVYLDMPLKPNILDDISKDVCEPFLPVFEVGNLGFLTALDLCPTASRKIRLYLRP